MADEGGEGGYQQNPFRVPDPRCSFWGFTTFLGQNSVMLQFESGFAEESKTQNLSLLKSIDRKLKVVYNTKKSTPQVI